MRWDILCRPRQKGGLGIRSIADTNASLLGKWMGAILDDTAGTWSKVFGELATACRMRHNKNVIRKEYNLPDLIWTNQPLHLFGAELGTTMLSCWNVIRQDLVLDLQGIPFPDYITLRDLVNLVLQTRKKAEASTKEVMNELRLLKITQPETIWTRRYSLREKYVVGVNNEQRRSEGASIQIFFYRILGASGINNAPVRSSSGWKLHGKPMAGNFTVAAKNWYRDKPLKTDLTAHLNRKWLSSWSEKEWERIFDKLWHSRNANKDKIFM